MTSTSFAITLPHGRPIPQPRPRAMSMGKAARVYNPTSERLDAYRLSIGASVPDEFRNANHDRMVCLVTRMMYERPKSHLTRAGNLRKGVPEAPISQRDGDFDNLQKPIADVLQEQALYLNDSQITDAHFAKRYAPPGMPGLVCVTTHLWDSLPDEWLGFPKYLEVSNA